MLTTPHIQQQQRLLKLIAQDNLDGVEELVSQLPTLNFIEPVSCDTPLVLAVSNSKQEIIAYLLAHGADPNFANQQTLPLLAAIDRSIEGDKYCFDAGTPEEVEDPLFIVQLLIDFGADFMLKDPQGESAYEFAQTRRHPAKDLFASLKRS